MSMAYGPPGMSIYPIVPDLPSGTADYPAIAQSPALSGSVQYAASFNVGTALVIFAVLWFGSVAALHYVSSAAGKV